MLNDSIEFVVQKRHVIDNLSDNKAKKKMENRKFLIVIAVQAAQLQLFGQHSCD